MTNQKDTNNVVDIKPYIKATPSVDSFAKNGAKYHSNPIFKKYFVINAKNDKHKFTIADLFE